VTLRLITDPAGEPSEPPHGAVGALKPDAYEDLFYYAGGLLAILDDEGRFIAVNPACAQVLGREPHTLVGQSLLDFLDPHDPSPALRSSVRAERVAGAPDGPQERAVELLARHRHQDGTWRWLLWTGASHERRWYLSARDVTEWIRLEDRVGRDPLTQLPNRDVFTTELSHALARHERTSRCLAVLFIDIDSFKNINDSIGHEAGDHLLGQVADRLRDAVRGGDMVGRLGGDEFVILAESLESDSEAATVARRTLAAFAEPVELGTAGPIKISASVGVTTAKGLATTAERLIHEADIAMYEAKKAGPGGFAVFDVSRREPDVNPLATGSHTAAPRLHDLRR
jgi:diguanylate cyclase (GGDEF)-like protein/PAS domain S-box-containing protein